jgi:radical SAM family protein/iron-sulfur cluster protein
MPDIYYAPISLREKALGFRKDAVRLKQGQMVPPTMAIVYPTYSCNMRCFGCVSNAENAIPANVDSSLFDRFIVSFAEMGGESVEFSGGGEPTLHPHFTALIDSLASQNLQFGMITNGTKPEVVAKALAYSGTRYIRVSVYTVNQLDGLNKIVANRDSLGSKARVGGKILLGISDIPLLEYLVDEILNTGVDFVSIKSKRHCADDPELLDEFEKAKLAAEIQDLVLHYPGKVFGSVRKTHQRGACWLSPLHTVIDALGTVWVCCYYQDREEDISIGSLQADSFYNLWYGSAHRAAMDRVIIPECDFYDCRFHVYHDVLNSELGNPSDLAFI